MYWWILVDTSMIFKHMNGFKNEILRQIILYFLKVTTPLSVAKTEFLSW